MAVNFNLVGEASTANSSGSLLSSRNRGSVLSTKSLQNIYDYNQTSQGLEYGVQSRDIALADEVNNLISYIANSEEDKAAAQFADMIEYWTNPENSTVYGGMNEKEMKAIIRSMIQEQTEDGSTAEELIRTYTKNLKEVEHQQIVYGEDRCDSVTEGQLLEMICDIKNTEAGQNGWNRFWSGVANVFNVANWDNAFWCSESRVK